METSPEELISNDSLSRGLQLKKLKLSALAPLIAKTLKLEKINALYASHSHTSGVEFSGNILEALNIRFSYSEEELRNIPADEPFILIANHPYGGIDGLILLNLVTRVRPDFRIMANFLLQQIPPLKEHFVPVDPFENPLRKSKNISGIKRCLALLQQGHPIGMFPAGEVSALKLNNLKVSDRMWNPVVGKMIMKARVKVVPVYFSGRNSMAFNLLGLLHPALRTAKLPSELFNKQDEEITVRIGKPVPVKSLDDFTGPDELLRFLRAKTYALGSSLEVSSTPFLSRLHRIGQPQDIISETPQELLLADLERIRGTGLLVAHDHMEVYISSARFIPNILREISRLREVTFREVGEGTNKACDTDEYDLHYKHLFLWDAQKNRLAGAYRIGMGDVLFRRYKKKGFYLNELFRIRKEFYPVLRQSLELGRSFIVKEYQRQPYSLMLLWKGVNEFLKREGHRYRYLIGPVSISNSFSSLSKDLLVDFIRKNHYDDTLSRYVTPRKKYKYRHKGEGAGLRELNNTDIRVLDGMIAEIETSRNKIPVLLKKYLKQHARIIAFNIDPKFNNALDGFLVMNIDQVPDETFEMVTRQG